MIIRLKIDCAKIQKQRLFKGKVAKDGHTPMYLDVTLLENRDGEDQYGNAGMAIQDVSKEEREQGVKGPILGNFKILATGQGARRQETKPAASATASPSSEGADADDGVPF